MGPSLTSWLAWDHEGGHWKHYGYSISQALMLSRLEYGLSQDENPEGNIQSHTELSPVVLSETKCEHALESRLERECQLNSGRRIATVAGVSWKELAMWLSDPSLIPQEKVERIAFHSD